MKTPVVPSTREEYSSILHYLRTGQLPPDIAQQSTTLRYNFRRRMKAFTCDDAGVLYYVSPAPAPTLNRKHHKKKEDVKVDAATALSATTAATSTMNSTVNTTTAWNENLPRGLDPVAPASDHDEQQAVPTTTQSTHSSHHDPMQAANEAHAASVPLSVPRLANGQPVVTGGSKADQFIVRRVLSGFEYALRLQVMRRFHGRAHVDATTCFDRIYEHYVGIKRSDVREFIENCPQCSGSGAVGKEEETSLLDENGVPSVSPLTVESQQGDVPESLLNNNMTISSLPTATTTVTTAPATTALANANVLPAAPVKIIHDLQDLPHQPFDHLVLDVLDMRQWAQENEGYAYILLVVDTFSRFLFSFAMMGCDAMEVSNHLFNLCLREGCPLLVEDARTAYLRVVSPSMNLMNNNNGNNSNGTSNANVANVTMNGNNAAILNNLDESNNEMDEIPAPVLHLAGSMPPAPLVQDVVDELKRLLGTHHVESGISPDSQLRHVWQQRQLKRRHDRLQRQWRLQQGLVSVDDSSDLVAASEDSLVDRVLDTAWRDGVARAQQLVSHTFTHQLWCTADQPHLPPPLPAVQQHASLQLNASSGGGASHGSTAVLRHSRWMDLLPAATFAHNLTCHAVHGSTPFSVFRKRALPDRLQLKEGVCAAAREALLLRKSSSTTSSAPATSSSHSHPWFALTAALERQHAMMKSASVTPSLMTPLNHNNHNNVNNNQSSGSNASSNSSSAMQQNSASHSFDAVLKELQRLQSHWVLGSSTVDMEDGVEVSDETTPHSLDAALEKALDVAARHQSVVANANQNMNDSLIHSGHHLHDNLHDATPLDDAAVAMAVASAVAAASSTSLNSASSSAPHTPAALDDAAISRVMQAATHWSDLQKSTETSDNVTTTDVTGTTTTTNHNTANTAMEESECEEEELLLSSNSSLPLHVFTDAHSSARAMAPLASTVAAVASLMGATSRDGTQTPRRKRLKKSNS